MLAMPLATPADVESVSLAAKVAFLRRPATHAASALHVQTVETHASWVFLAGDESWKLKKPITTELLDYSTPAARQRCCDQEVRLNAALAPGVYRGTVPLSRQGGRLQLGPGGTAVDWLVRGRCLPAERMLDAEIAAGTLHIADVGRLGTRLARFYAAAPAVSLPAPGYSRWLERALHRHFTALERSPHVARPLLLALASELLGFLAENRGLVERRHTGGHLVDGHGDPRPEHVCLLAEPVMIDRLEFAPELRLVDPADELASLDMECARLGADWVGPELIAAWRRGSGDAPPPVLMSFYKSVRALLRAKLALAHLGAARSSDDAPWRRRGEDYLGLAAHYTAALR